MVPAGAAGPVLASGTLEALIGSDYTLAVAGQGSSATVLTFTDENAAPSVPTGKAGLRVINLSPNAGALDVAWAGGALLAEAVDFGEASEPVETLAGLTLNLEVRAAGNSNALVTVPGVTLQENRAYTLFVLGLRPGTPGLSAALNLDAGPAARLRLLHAATGVGDVDALIDGVRVYSSLPFGWITHYAVVEPGVHTLRTVPAGQSSPTLLERSITLPAEADRTLVLGGTGQVLESWGLADNNSLPAVGNARVRVAQAAPGAPAVDVVIVGGTTLASSVGYRQAGAYASVAAGTYDLAVRETGGAAALLTLEDITLDPGSIYTVSLAGVTGGSPALRATVHHDVVATGRLTQATYAIRQAQTGEWKVKLSGYYAPTDRYELVIIGAKPRPGLAEVRVSSTGATAARASYRLTASDPGTVVRIHANPWDAAQEGAPAFEGILVATINNPPMDGSLQNVNLDLSALKSGTYRLWVEADDQNNAPVRVYAPDTISVTVGWQLTWTAGLQATQEFGAIHAAWNRHPNPDVDSYVLIAQTTSPEATTVITVGNALTTTLWAVTPGQQYELAVEAYDEGAGRRSLSEEINVTAAVASYTLTASTAAPTITGGQAITVTLSVRTALAGYPDTVGLSLGAAPAGLSAQLDATAVVPTKTGVAVSLVIQASDALPTGKYDLKVEARGGGVARDVTLEVNVRKPYFELAAVPAQLSLAEGGSAQVTVRATAFHGADAPILLDLQDEPAGLYWELSAPTVMPGGTVTLTLRDTGLLKAGRRTLRLVGHDGSSAAEATIQLDVSKYDRCYLPMLRKQ